VVSVKGVKIGIKNIAVIAGPCSIENYDLLLKIAKAVKRSGADILRGGAFKPRTSPYAFQGLGEEGLRYLREAGDKHGLLVVTEVMDPRNVELVSEYSDMLQIGADECRRRASDCVARARGVPFMLSAGCEVPAGVGDDVFCAFCEAAAG